MLRELDINEMNAVSGGWGPSGSTGGSTSGWSIPGDWDGNGVPDTNFGNDSGYFMGSTVGGEIGYSGGGSGGSGGGTDATFTGDVPNPAHGENGHDPIAHFGENLCNVEPFEAGAVVGLTCTIGSAGTAAAGCAIGAGATIIGTAVAQHYLCD